MIPRTMMLLLLVCSCVWGHETREQGDLVAEPTETVSASAKREVLLDSYGDPLPPDAYGPPKELAVVTHLPADSARVLASPVSPVGVYGPPSPVSVPSPQYEGPPPPAPRPHYPPPRLSYHTPKLHYNPKQNYQLKYAFKKNYGLKQGLPKPTYGAPFKLGPRPTYSPPQFNVLPPIKPLYGPPKPVYGPPSPLFPEVSSVTVTTNIGGVHQPDSVQLPAPIYGTPVGVIPQDLKPNFPLLSESYGPPGVVVGPAGPALPLGPEVSVGPTGPPQHVVVQETGSVEYGPPQPDPDPRPPHPGIPAPPTPPHVVYDGWRPIPGVSHPHPLVEEHYDVLEQALPGPQVQQFYSGGSQADISTSVTSSAHHDAIADLDIRALTGGDTNHIDQAKTIFEAHYTDGPAGPLITDSYTSPPVDSVSGGPYQSSTRAQGAKLLPPSGIYGVPPGGEYGAPPRAPPPHLPLPYGAVSGGPHHSTGWPKHPIKFREPVPHGLIEHVGQTTHGKDQHGIDHLTHGIPYLSPPIKDIKEASHAHEQNSVSLSVELSDLFSVPHTGSPVAFQQPSTSYGSPIDSYSVPLLTVADHTASGSSTDSVATTLDGTILANLSSLDAAAILKHCPYHEAILKAAKSGEKIPADLAAKYIASLNSLGTTLNNNQLTEHRDLTTSSQTVVQNIQPNKYTNKAKFLRETKHKDDKIKHVSEEILRTSEKIKSLSEETRRLQQKIASGNHQLNYNQVHNQDIPVKGKLGSYSLQIQSSNGRDNPTIPHEQLLSEGLLHSILEAIEQPTTGNVAQTQVQTQTPNIQTQIPNHNFGQSHQSAAQSHQSVSQSHQNGQSHQNHNLIHTLPNHNVNPTQSTNYVVHTQSHHAQNHQQQHQQNHAQSHENHQHQEQHQNQQQNQQNQGQSSYLNQNLHTNDDGLVLPAGYEPVDRTKKAKDQDTQQSQINLKKMLKDEIINNNRGDVPECELKGAHSHVNYEIKPVEETDNDVAVYFKRRHDEKTEPITEISVATSISENSDKHKSKNKSFGEKIKKN